MRCWHVCSHGVLGEADCLFPTVPNVLTDRPLREWARMCVCVNDLLEPVSVVPTLEGHVRSQDSNISMSKQSYCWTLVGWETKPHNRSGVGERGSGGGVQTMAHICTKQLNGPVTSCCVFTIDYCGAARHQNTLPTMHLYTACQRWRLHNIHTPKSHKWENSFTKPQHMLQFSTFLGSKK